MNLFRGIGWGLLLAAPFWAAFYFGAKAIAAPVTDAPVFLERRGLHAQPVPLVVVPDGALSGKTAAGSTADGAAYEDHVAIEQDVADEGGLVLAQVALHEYLHQASMFRWTLAEREEFWDGGEFGRLYEEGLVEAATIDLLPAFWRFTVGKPLRAWTTASYWPYVVSWRVWSSRATGKPWRSKVAREWRAAALTWGPAKRVEVVEGLTL